MISQSRTIFWRRGKFQLNLGFWVVSNLPRLFRNFPQNFRNFFCLGYRVLQTPWARLHCLPSQRKTTSSVIHEANTLGSFYKSLVHTKTTNLFIFMHIADVATHQRLFGAVLFPSPTLENSAHQWKQTFWDLSPIIFWIQTFSTFIFLEHF